MRGKRDDKDSPINFVRVANSSIQRKQSLVMQKYGDLWNLHALHFVSLDMIILSLCPVSVFKLCEYIYKYINDRVELIWLK